MAETEHLVVLCYDISAARTRRRVAAFLEARLVRVQASVFEGPARAHRVPRGGRHAGRWRQPAPLCDDARRAHRRRADPRAGQLHFCERYNSPAAKRRDACRRVSSANPSTLACVHALEPAAFRPATGRDASKEVYPRRAPHRAGLENGNPKFRPPSDSPVVDLVRGCRFYPIGDSTQVPTAKRAAAIPARRLRARDRRRNAH